MASYVEHLEGRVRSLAEVAAHLNERLAQVEQGQQELLAHLERVHRDLDRLLDEQRGSAAEARAQIKEMVQAQQRLQQEVVQMLLPIKEQLGKLDGKLEGKREATTLLLTAFLSGLGVLVSGLMGYLNLQARLRGQ